MAKGRYNKGYKRPYKKKNPYRQDRVKTMVTGKPPTLVERIASGAGSVARLATAVAPVIAAINTELKYSDTAVQMVAYDPGTNDWIQLLSGISQGVDDTERIGNSVLVKNIAIKAQMQYTADSTDLIVSYRFILFVWKANANSNPPSSTKLFEVPSNFFSAFNKDYTDQMVILKDKIIVKEAQTIPSTTAELGISYLKIFKKLNFHLRWLNSTTGVTENHIYVCFRCDSPLIGNSGLCNLYSRLNFTDN